MKRGAELQLDQEGKLHRRSEDGSVDAKKNISLFFVFTVNCVFALYNTA